MEGDMPKLDVMLMRSKSGNQILDIDFGAAEAMMANNGGGAGGPVAAAANGGNQPLNTSVPQAQHGAYNTGAWAVQCGRVQPGRRPAAPWGAACALRLTDSHTRQTNSGHCAAYPPQATGVAHGYAGTVALPTPTSLPSSAPFTVPTRKLKIIEHHVHRIDTHAKDNGEPEEELVVSNLRHFSLKARPCPGAAREVARRSGTHGWIPGYRWRWST